MKISNALLDYLMDIYQGKDRGCRVSAQRAGLIVLNSTDRAVLTQKGIELLKEQGRIPHLHFTKGSAVMFHEFMNHYAGLFELLHRYSIETATPDYDYVEVERLTAAIVNKAQYIGINPAHPALIQLGAEGSENMLQIHLIISKREPS